MTVESGAMGGRGGLKLPKRRREGKPTTLGSVAKPLDPLREGPTADEAAAANAHKYEPHGINKTIKDLAGNSTFRTVLGGVSAGLISYAAYETIPAVQQAEQAALDATKAAWGEAVKFFGPQSIESSFPTALPASAFMPTSKEEAIKTYKQAQLVDINQHKGSIGFPIDNKTLANSPNLRQSSIFDAILPPYIDKAQLEKEGIKNVVRLTGLSKGTKIYSPVEGKAIAINTAGIVGEGLDPKSPVPAYTSFRIMFRDKDGNDCFITISGLWAKPLIDAPPFPTGHNPNYDYGKSIGLFEPLFELTTDLQAWNGEGVKLDGEDGQVALRLGFQQGNPSSPIPLNLDYLREPGGKIILPSTKP